MHSKEKDSNYVYLSLLSKRTQDTKLTDYAWA